MAALPDDDSTMDLVAPLTGDAYRIARRTPAGHPVVVIEPHDDDFILSASGSFLADPRPLTVITVFSRSTSVHARLESQYTDIESVSRLRECESAQSLVPFGAQRVRLGHTAAEKPYRLHAPSTVDQVTEELARALDRLPPEAQLLAPASVTRHPDHLLVHQAARRLGCRWFWEDVAFWPTYALAGCDRHLFHQRAGHELRPRIVDITGVVLDKFTLLHMHGSQMYPAAKMYRPIRHAYTVAADMLLSGPDHIPGPYAERFYHLGGMP
jgi:LmbE family N-acetylglucosaminyl deacetylase